MLNSFVRATCEVCGDVRSYWGEVAPDGSFGLPEGWFGAAAVDKVYTYCAGCRGHAREDVHAKLKERGFQFTGFGDDTVEEIPDTDKLN
jgi:hypothetical protein